MAKSVKIKRMICKLSKDKSMIQYKIINREPNYQNHLDIHSKLHNHVQACFNLLIDAGIDPRSININFDIQ